jgi:hypothetical protein
MLRMTSLRLPIAAVLVAITTSAFAGPAVDNYKTQVSAAIKRWIAETSPDDNKLGNMFNELDKVNQDPKTTLADVKQKQAEITSYKKGTVESLHKGSIVNAIMTIPSPIKSDKSLATQKGTGSSLAQWMSTEITSQTGSAGWKQIKGVDAKVTWSDDAFNGGQFPALVLTYKYTKDETALKTLKMR